MNLRYRGMLAAIQDGVNRKRISPQRGRALSEIFNRHSRRESPITMAFQEAIRCDLLPQTAYRLDKLE